MKKFKKYSNYTNSVYINFGKLHAASGKWSYNYDKTIPRGVLMAILMFLVLNLF